MNMNRLANAKNKFQGETKKVLTVCSAGLLRSPTLAHLLFKKYGFNTRSVGSSKEYALIHIDDVLIYWADEIIFIDQENLDEARMYCNIDEEKCFVLNIPDDFEYMDDNLQNVLMKKYKELVIGI